MPMPAIDFCLWGPVVKNRPSPGSERWPQVCPEGGAGRELSSSGVLWGVSFIKHCYNFLKKVKKMFLKLQDFTIYPLLFFPL